MILALARFVDASYVLPYPSLMPGHKLYDVIRIVDDLKRYWHWGNLASYRYYLGQSDKALVEAKTLFEYGQYLLAMEALDRSNRYITQVPGLLKRAKDEGKTIETYEREFGEAMDKHTSTLTKLLDELPDQFTWLPEREDPIQLRIHGELNKALLLRK